MQDGDASTLRRNASHKSHLSPMPLLMWMVKVSASAFAHPRPSFHQENSEGNHASLVPILVHRCLRRARLFVVADVPRSQPQQPQQMEMPQRQVERPRQEVTYLQQSQEMTYVPQTVSFRLSESPFCNDFSRLRVFRQQRVSPVLHDLSAMTAQDSDVVNGGQLFVTGCRDSLRSHKRYHALRLFCGSHCLVAHFRQRLRIWHHLHPAARPCFIFACAGCLDFAHGEI